MVAIELPAGACTPPARPAPPARPRTPPPIACGCNLHRCSGGSSTTRRQHLDLVHLVGMVAIALPLPARHAHRQRWPAAAVAIKSTAKQVSSGHVKQPQKAGTSSISRSFRTRDGRAPGGPKHQGRPLPGTAHRWQLVKLQQRRPAAGRRKKKEVFSSLLSPPPSALCSRCSRCSRSVPVLFPSVYGHRGTPENQQRRGLQTDRPRLFPPFPSMNAARASQIRPTHAFLGAGGHISSAKKVARRRLPAPHRPRPIGQRPAQAKAR